MEYCITDMRADDWDAVREIYVEGIATGNATFENAPPSWEQWERSHLEICRLVARRQAGPVLGWSALSPVSQRCVYAGVAEISIYVSAASRGLGIGKALLAKAITDSEANGIWTLQAGIFPENAASIATFKGCGFREVGYRERLGQMHGIWRNVLLFERRSA